MKNESESSSGSLESVILDRGQLEVEKASQIPKERSLTKITVDKPFGEASDTRTSESSQSNDVSSSSSDGKSTNRTTGLLLTWWKRWSFRGLPMLLLGILLGSFYERNVGVSKGVASEARAEARCGPITTDYIAKTDPSLRSYHCHSHQ